MADHYTQHYGLSQWEPTDAFVRADFNRDNRRVDAALNRVEEHAALMGWNVYNLLLRDYYEGKYTGWKKALIFDGFLSKPAYDQLTEGFYWDGDSRCLCLDGTVQKDADLAYGTAFTKELAPNESATIRWTTRGSGKLRSVQTYLTGGGEVRFSVLQEDEGNVLTMTYGADGVFTLESLGVFLPRGTYLIRLTNVSTRTMTMHSASADMPFGVKITMLPDRFEEGTYTGKPVDPKTSYRSLRGWARHCAGAVRMRLESGGAWEELPVTSADFGVRPDGTNCNETAFALDLPEERSGPLQIQLVLTAAAFGQTQLFDFGLVCI